MKKANNLKQICQQKHPYRRGWQPQLMFLCTNGGVGGTVRLDRVKRFLLSSGQFPGSLLITLWLKNLLKFSCQDIQSLVQPQSRYSKLMVEKRHHGADFWFCLGTQGTLIPSTRRPGAEQSCPDLEDSTKASQALPKTTSTPCRALGTEAKPPSPSSAGTKHHSISSAQNSAEPSSGSALPLQTPMLLCLLQP